LFERFNTAKKLHRLIVLLTLEFQRNRKVGQEYIQMLFTQPLRSGVLFHAMLRERCPNFIVQRSFTNPTFTNSRDTLFFANGVRLPPGRKVTPRLTAKVPKK